MCLAEGMATVKELREMLVPYDQTQTRKPIGQRNEQEEE